MPTDGPGRTLLGVLIGTVTALADLASLDLASGRSTVTDGVLTVTGKTTLTNSDAFAGFYGAGDKLDDLTLTLGSPCSALPDPPAPAGPQAPGPASQDLVPPLTFRPAGRLTPVRLHWCR